MFRTCVLGLETLLARHLYEMDFLPLVREGNTFWLMNRHVSPDALPYAQFSFQDIQRYLDQAVGDYQLGFKSCPHYDGKILGRLGVTFFGPTLTFEDDEDAFLFQLVFD